MCTNFISVFMYQFSREKGVPPAIDYKKFSDVNPELFFPLLNSNKVRTHLIRHQTFDDEMLKSWIADKISMDAVAGCKVRAIQVEGNLAGWCGIQLEDSRFGLAIVIDDKYWGLGIKVYRDLMQWAAELGHTSVFVQLLNTRPEYRFLRRRAKQVCVSELMGHCFTTYELGVPSS